MTALPQCPTCGHAVNWLDGVHLDLNTNTLIVPDRLIRLSPVEAEVLHLLLERAPRRISSDAICRAVYPLDPMSDNLLKVFICKLRRKLAGTPWAIRNVCAFNRIPEAGGYYLTREEG